MDCVFAFAGACSSTLMRSSHSGGGGCGAEERRAKEGEATAGVAGVRGSVPSDARRRRTELLAFSSVLIGEVK